MNQSPFSTFAPFLITTGIVLFLLGTIYLISRLRSNKIHLSPRHALEGYFYLLTVISFITFTFGLVSLLNAGISGSVGKEFSYGRPPGYRPPPEGVTIYAPGEVRSKKETLTPEQQAELRQKEEQRQLEEHKRRQEQNNREGLTQGIGMVFVGGIVWALHLWGRRRFFSFFDSFSQGIRRTYLVVMLVIYSIMGIASITMAVSRVLRQYILYDIDKYDFIPAPGAMVAASIIFAPIWIYYLRESLKEMRLKEK